MPEEDAPPITHPPVIVRKLGRHGVYGYCYDNPPLIELDARLTGLKRLEITVHEYLHHVRPELAEEAVTETAAKLADFLWSQSYRATRRIDAPA